MRITETEYVALIREAVDGAVIMARFGPGWVALDEIPENEWAIQRVEEMRVGDWPDDEVELRIEQRAEKLESEQLATSPLTARSG